MENLIHVSDQLIAGVTLKYSRYLSNQINWDNRLIGIKGARGTGKTTLVLQWLKKEGLPSHKRVYFSLDELYFTQNDLMDTINEFYQNGGKIVVLDEVHKYPGWSMVIKNLYDRYQDLKIIFTGSSIIDISRQESDLSRRSLMYELKGLSFREFLSFEHDLNYDPFSLQKILNQSDNIREVFPNDFRPYEYFDEYLRFGYYPFYQEDRVGHYQRINQLIRTIVEYDMAEIKGFDIRQAKKMLQLLAIISKQVPFKPNLKSLAEKSGIHRNSISNYLIYLEEARLISLRYQEGISIAGLQKPEKIFLDNTTILNALSRANPDKGAMREVFFNNQLSVVHRVNHGKHVDFVVDEELYFEVGGKNKGNSQLPTGEKAWVVKDQLEYPVGKSLPLWLFGFLY